MNNALTSRFPAVPLRISRDSLKATLMPGSLSTGRPFFPKDLTRVNGNLLLTIQRPMIRRRAEVSRHILNDISSFFWNDEVQISTEIEMYR